MSQRTPWSGVRQSCRSQFCMSTPCFLTRCCIYGTRTRINIHASADLGLDGLIIVGVAGPSPYPRVFWGRALLGNMDQVRAVLSTRSNSTSLSLQGCIVELSLSADKCNLISTQASYQAKVPRLAFRACVCGQRHDDSVVPPQSWGLEVQQS